MKHLIILMALSLGFSACHFNFKVIRGNGDIVLREIDTDYFTDLDINGNYKVELYYSDQPKVVVETDENLFEYLEIESRNGLLSINNKNTLKPSKQLLIEIYYKELRSIKSSGASSIEHPETLMADELKVGLSGAGSIKLSLKINELDLNLSGAGVLEVSGQANSQIVNLSGAGALEAKDLESQYCEINISGVGNAKVNVVKELNATISGLGNIEYFGNPEKISQNVSGMGKVKKGEEAIEQNEVKEI